MARSQLGAPVVRGTMLQVCLVLVGSTLDALAPVEAHAVVAPEVSDGDGWFEVGNRNNLGGWTGSSPAQLPGFTGDDRRFIVRPACTVSRPDHICRSNQVCSDGSSLMEIYLVDDDGSQQLTSAHCASPSDSSEAPQVTSELVLRALRRIDLPVPQLTVQPPGGKTLVNLEAILSTEAEAFTRTLTLAGQRVTVELTPSSYQWEHGDGTTQQTDGPGQPYRRGLPMDRYVTHTYTSADVTVQARVTTTWSARFRTPDQPWQSVDGTVSMTSPPTPLRVVEATPLLAKVR